MTQEPDTQQEQYGQEQPDPFALLAQAHTSARASLDTAVHQLAVRFADTATAQEDRDAAHTEALHGIQHAAEAIQDAFATAAAKVTTELARLKQQGATHHESTGKRISQGTTALIQRFDEAGARLEEISASQAEHYRLTGAVLEKVGPLPEGLHDYAESTRERIGDLAASVAEHQALSADTHDQISSLTSTITGDGESTRERIGDLAASVAEHQALSADTHDQISSLTEGLHDYAESTRERIGDLAASVAEHQALSADTHDQISSLTSTITGDGESTREQVGASLALLRSTLDAIKDTGADVRGVENALGMVIGAARDQILAPLRQHAEHTASLGDQHTTRLDNLHHLMDGVVSQQVSDGLTLETISEETRQLVQALPSALSQVLDALASTGEETRRIVLDVEERISAAVALTGERADQALTSIAGDLGHFATAFDTFAEQAATATSVDSLRGDVSALAELLATSTEDFTGAVQQAVSDMAAMRTAWTQESAQVLRALENMGRVFMDKANASEHARDKAVIDLGRRVARLELTRAPATIGS